jgi:hypothetical protein
MMPVKNRRDSGEDVKGKLEISVATQRDRRSDTPRSPSRTESGQQGSHEQQGGRHRRCHRVGASYTIQLTLQRTACRPRCD